MKFTTQTALSGWLDSLTEEFNLIAPRQVKWDSAIPANRAQRPGTLEFHPSGPVNQRCLFPAY